jgi:hypothetical protein
LKNQRLNAKSSRQSSRCNKKLMKLLLTYRWLAEQRIPPKPAPNVEAKNRVAAAAEYAWAMAERFRPALDGEPKNDNANEDLYNYWIDRMLKAAAVVMPYQSATYRAPPWWTSAPPARPGGSIPTRRAGWSSLCSARSEHVARPSLQTEPRPTRTMALTACACWKRSNRLAERQLRVQMLQGDGGPGKALDQGALDGAQPIGATEITFDIGDKAIECLAALVRASSWRQVSSCRGLPCASGDELVSLGLRVGNPSAIGWHQRVNFPASLLPVAVTPTTSRRIATRSLRRKMARSSIRA